MRLIDIDAFLESIDNPVQYRTLKRLLDEAETVECKGDAISRQGLKESLLSEDYEKHEYCFPCKEIMKLIDEQPSAQPEIIRCKDCVYYHPTYCEIWSKYGTVQTRENGYCYMAERREEGDQDG